MIKFLYEKLNLKEIEKGVLVFAFKMVDIAHVYFPMLDVDVLVACRHRNYKLVLIATQTLESGREAFRNNKHTVL